MLTSGAATREIKYETGLFNRSQPHGCASRSQLNDPDQHSLHEVLHGEKHHHYSESMKFEISQLLK